MEKAEKVPQNPECSRLENLKNTGFSGVILENAPRIYMVI
jgi:hypothetical protein